MEFSKKIKIWLDKPGVKTIGSLNKAFSEKGFVVIMFFLLFPTATPLPTGGVTYVFEISAMFVSLQLIIGRKTVWLPKWLRKVKVGSFSEEKVLPFMLRMINKAGAISRHNLQKESDLRVFRTLLGFLFLVFTFTALLAPPFVGLDTLPSLGVVLLALSVIVEDRNIFILGIITGIVGSVLSLLPWVLILNRVATA